MPHNATVYRVLRRACRADRRIDLAIAYGSQVSGRATADSDWDIAVALSRPPMPGDQIALCNAFAVACHRNDLDVTVLNHASPLLRWEVATTGRVIFERRRGLFRNFQVKAFRRHQDARRLYAATSLYLQRWVAQHSHGRPAIA